MGIKNILFFTFCLFIISSSAQNGNSDEVNLLFYNVENLFDTADDPLTSDEDHTPKGELHWTTKRLKTKLLNVSKVILNASGWNVPDIVALAEVENRWVVEQLLKTTPLERIPYKIVHKESPDHRGLDVVLLYNEEHFYPLEYHYYPLISETNEIEKTRELLYVSGILNETDTLHIFVNHWPSRYSGLLESKPARLAAARLLKSKTDELFRKYHLPKIIIVGDFNDNPTDESVTDILQAKNTTSQIEKDDLYNLSAGWLRGGTGTLKYQSKWDVFDQIIVSGTLLNNKYGLITSEKDANIIQLPFLFEEDKKLGDKKPFRTYSGYSYLGGFSDHLPVMLKLYHAN
jgi:endonuclease/exonuclease/phosphatase family metal-dependent hydrolase